MTRRYGGEDGYALIAAVAAIFIFALLALSGISAMRAAVITGTAEVDSAKAAAAADAGVALAIHHLLDPDDRTRWTIDGQTRRARFDAALLTVRIEDERGKVPLNLVEEEQATAMLEAVGLEGQALRVARDSFLDWVDDDDEPRANGAERGYYAPLGYAPRNSGLASVGELGRIRGFSPALVARLSRFVTVYFGAGSFDVRYAQPAAIGVMYGGGQDGPAAIARARELAGQRTALGFSEAAEIVGRPLSVHVEATLPTGARAERTVVIELTGTDTRPYIVRNWS